MKPFHPIMKTGKRSPQSSRGLSPRVLCLFSVILAVFIASGIFYYSYELNRIRQIKASELNSIARMKVEQIQRWRRERSDDARRLAESPAFKKVTAEWLHDPARLSGKDELAGRLQLEEDLGVYFQALLVDAGQKILLVPNARPPEMEADSWEAVRRSLTEHAPVFSQLHHTASGIIHIDIAMAIRDATGQPLAMIVLTTNADEFLFPMIRLWPTPSRSGETLLVRREGNEVIFLNELRHLKNTALNLRFPVTRTTLPAAQAVLGRTGLFLGRDYRGLKVLAELMPVPGTDWYVVSKENESEIFGEVRFRVLTVSLVVLMLILCFSAGVVLWSQKLRMEERKQAEGVLRESERRYRGLFESSWDAMMTLDPPDWHFSSGNAAMLRMFKAKDPAEFKGLHPWGLSPLRQPDGRLSEEKATEMIALALREGSHFFDWDHQRIDGEIFPAEVLLNRVDREGGALIQATVRDISDRRQAEALLRDSETRYRRLFEASTDAILILDAPSGMITDVNPFLIKALGYSREQLLGKKIWEIGFLKDIIASKDNFLQLQREKYVRYEDLPLETADGRKIDVEFVSNVYQVDHHEVIQCNIRDITERKRMEMELAQVKEMQFRTLMEVLPSKVFLKDRNSVYIACNENYANDLKIQPKEIAGKTDYDFFPTPLASRSRFDDKRIMDSGIAESREEEYQVIGDYLAGSKTTYINCVKAPVHDKAGNVTGLFGLFWDITEQKKLEAEKDRVELLASTSEAKNKFTSMVSHELRSPLAVIKEALDIVLEGMVGSLNGEQKDVLGMAKNNIDRLGRLINNVLDFQKIASGKMGFDFLENDLNEVAAEVHKTMGVLAKRKGLDLRLEAEEGLGKMKFDQDRLIQVLTNLMSNAIANTEKGAITLSVKKEEGVAHVIVRDSGNGISAEDLSKLFQPFEQVEGSKGKKKGGTGLGLAISKEIILAHRGKIWAESEPGQGSAFHFTLPR